MSSFSLRRRKTSGAWQDTWGQVRLQHVHRRRFKQKEAKEHTETALENKNPATPDQKAQVDKIATTMLASIMSFSTE
jgi:hypothetical protein